MCYFSSLFECQLRIDASIFFGGCVFSFLFVRSMILILFVGLGLWSVFFVLEFFLAFHDFFVESSILAQDERWRRA